MSPRARSRLKKLAIRGVCSAALLASVLRVGYVVPGRRWDSSSEEMLRHAARVTLVGLHPELSSVQVEDRLRDLRFNRRSLRSKLNGYQGQSAPQFPFLRGPIEVTASDPSLGAHEAVHRFVELPNGNHDFASTAFSLYYQRAIEGGRILSQPSNFRKESVSYGSFWRVDFVNSDGIKKTVRRTAMGLSVFENGARRFFDLPAVNVEAYTVSNPSKEARKAWEEEHARTYAWVRAQLEEEKKLKGRLGRELFTYEKEELEKKAKELFPPTGEEIQSERLNETAEILERVSGNPAAGMTFLRLVLHGMPVSRAEAMAISGVDAVHEANFLSIAREADNAHKLFLKK